MLDVDPQMRSTSLVIDQKASDASQTIVELKAVDDSSSDSSRCSMDLKTSSHGLPTGLGLSMVDEESSLLSPPSLEVRDVSHQILDIIFEYPLNNFDDSEHRLAGGTPKFLSVIDQFVMAGRRVEACLPAFPFKSANKVYKVLGTLPDKAEELALERLNTMCTRIKQVYKPGARITIISDGITYNGTSMTVLDLHSHANRSNQTCCRYRIVIPGLTEKPCAR
jgi:hypothetical protein